MTVRRSVGEKGNTGLQLCCDVVVGDDFSRRCLAKQHVDDGLTAPMASGPSDLLEVGMQQGIDPWGASSNFGKMQLGFELGKLVG